MKQPPALIVAFLQNQWFHDSQRMQAMLDRNPERREHYLAATLFMGCLTGKRLKATLGEELCQEIVWEEASPQIADKSSGVFPADPAHMRTVIHKWKPSIILCFGRIAADGINKIRHDFNGGFVLYFPHPTARGHGTVSALKAAAEMLRKRLEVI